METKQIIISVSSAAMSMQISRFDVLKTKKRKQKFSFSEFQ